MPAIICEGVDVTEHVGAMFDALVGSMDWGSGFLTDDQIEAILTVATLAGFDTAAASPSRTQELKLFNEPPPIIEPKHLWPKNRDTPISKKALADWDAAYRAWGKRKEKALATWRAQFQAKVEALRKEANER